MNIEQVDQEIEINREGVKVVADGFRGFTLLANQIMIDEGVGTDDGEGNLLLPAGEWLNLRKYLKALRRVEEEVGSSVLMAGGQTVPKYADLPPTIVDIYSALAALDIAYHMNHRKFGKTLFDPETGTMEEGIGHHYVKGKQGDTRFEVTSDTPYPCAYDHGIMIGMAQRFKPDAQVAHGPGCRSKGAASCTYVVTFK